MTRRVISIFAATILLMLSVVAAANECPRDLQELLKSPRCSNAISSLSKSPLRVTADDTEDSCVSMLHATLLATNSVPCTTAVEFEAQPSLQSGKHMRRLDYYYYTFSGKLKCKFVSPYPANLTELFTGEFVLDCDEVDTGAIWFYIVLGLLFGIPLAIWFFSWIRDKVTDWLDERRKRNDPTQLESEPENDARPRGKRKAKKPQSYGSAP